MTLRLIDPHECHTSVEVRPGVRLPDWSVVQSKAASDALDDIVNVVGIEKGFDGFSEVEDQVRQALIFLYGTLGRAPKLTELAEETGLSIGGVRGSVGKLRSRDLVVLEESGEIVGAYPFTEQDTGHRVKLGERTLNAMCAVDALGVGAMFRRDFTISSFCRRCGEPITVRTRNRGDTVASSALEHSVVFNGIYDEGRAADSLCTVIAFFCSYEHLDDWSAERPSLKGHRLSLGEALEVGKALFQPVLFGSPRHHQMT